MANFAFPIFKIFASDFTYWTNFLFAKILLKGGESFEIEPSRETLQYSKPYISSSKGFAQAWAVERGEGTGANRLGSNYQAGGTVEFKQKSANLSAVYVKLWEGGGATIWEVRVTDWNWSLLTACNGVRQWPVRIVIEKTNIFTRHNLADLKWKRCTRKRAGNIGMPGEDMKREWSK
jgi:hypothetical protein